MAIKTDGVFELPAMLWERAVDLGAKREASNTGCLPEHIREKDPYGIHMAGVLGTLWLQSQVDFEDAAFIERKLFKPAGGTAIPETEPTLLSEEYGPIAVRTLMWHNGKHYFAINRRKHLALERHSPAYYPVIFGKYSRYVLVGQLIPYEAVSAWRVSDLRQHVQYPDLSHNITLGRLMDHHFSDTYDLHSLFHLHPRGC